MSATRHDADIPKSLPTWRVLAQLGIVPGYWGFCRHREYPPMSESPLTRQGLPPLLADLVRFYCMTFLVVANGASGVGKLVPSTAFWLWSFSIRQCQNMKAVGRGWCINFVNSRHWLIQSVLVWKPPGNGLQMVSDNSTCLIIQYLPYICNMYIGKILF